MERKDEVKQIDIKNCMCYDFDDIIRFWDRDIEFRDILLDQKSYETYENILIYGFHTKLQRVQNHCILGLIKLMDLLKPIMDLDVCYYLTIGIS